MILPTTWTVWIPTRSFSAVATSRPGNWISTNGVCPIFATSRSGTRPSREGRRQPLGADGQRTGIQGVRLSWTTRRSGVQARAQKRRGRRGTGLGAVAHRCVDADFAFCCVRFFSKCAWAGNISTRFPFQAHLLVCKGELILRTTPHRRRRVLPRRARADSLRAIRPRRFAGFPVLRRRGKARA